MRAVTRFKRPLAHTRLLKLMFTSIFTPSHNRISLHFHIQDSLQSNAHYQPILQKLQLSIRVQSQISCDASQWTIEVIEEVTHTMSFFKSTFLTIFLILCWCREQDKKNDTISSLISPQVPSGWVFKDFSLHRYLFDDFSVSHSLSCCCKFFLNTLK